MNQRTAIYQRYSLPSLTMTQTKIRRYTATMPIALITGATAGIGEATARLLVNNGFDIIITGRRSERLDALQKELTAQSGGRVLALVFDVRDRTAVNAAMRTLPDGWQDIDALINNAGLALGREPLQEGNPEDWDVMIDTNVKGLLSVTHAVVPGMIERKRGHIVNLGSIAGKQVYKGGGVYNATKFAVEALTKAMRIDFLPHNIRVTGICPGNAETEFSVVRFKGDGEKAGAVYQGFTPLSAEDIADAILWTLTRPPHVCINDLLIMPTAQADTVNIWRT